MKKIVVATVMACACLTASAQENQEDQRIQDKVHFMSKEGLVLNNLSLSEVQYNTELQGEDGGLSGGLPEHKKLHAWLINALPSLGLKVVGGKAEPMILMDTFCGSSICETSVWVSREAYIKTESGLTKVPKVRVAELTSKRSYDVEKDRPKAAFESLSGALVLFGATLAESNK